MSDSGPAGVGHEILEPRGLTPKGNHDNIYWNVWGFGGSKQEN